MPYLAVFIPPVAEADKDSFLARWPMIAGAVKALPMVADVTAGTIVGENGAPVQIFKFLEAIAFKTLEDAAAFAESDFVKEGTKKYKEKGFEVPGHDTFQISGLGADFKPPSYLGFSRIVVKDESKGAEAKKAWEELFPTVGKPAWGGKGVNDGPTVWMAITGWDSLEDYKTARQNPAVKGAWDHYRSFGEYHDCMIKLEQ